MKRLLAALLLVVAGCGDTPAPAPAETAAPATPAASVPPAAPHGVTARLVVTDLEGAPLADMLPIATRTPNAFDTPISHGERTGADGKGSMTITPSERLYIRAWDPSFDYFANNYFEVLPAQGDTLEEMAITMAKGCGLSMTLMLPGGVPAANAPVKLYMEHPARGPWWPDEATTDEHGAVTFRSVPPGQFIVKLEIERAGRLEIPGVALAPGGAVDLGTVTLLTPAREA